MFKPGDIVRCVDNGTFSLKLGDHYVVEYYHAGDLRKYPTVKIKDWGEYQPWRFVLVAIPSDVEELMLYGVAQNRP